MTTIREKARRELAKREIRRRKEAGIWNYKVKDLVEPAAVIASSVVAEPVSGFAGLAALPFGADVATTAIDKTRQALTYEPRLDKTKKDLSALSYMLEPVSNALADLSKVPGDYVFEETGSPLAGAIAYSAIPAFLEGLALKGAGKLGGTAYEMGDVSSFTKTPMGRQTGAVSGIGDVNADRIARAKNQGFDTETKYYHGTSAPIYSKIDLDQYATGEGGEGFGFGHHVTLSRDTADNYSADFTGSGEPRINEYYFKEDFKDNTLDWHLPIKDQNESVKSNLRRYGFDINNQTGEDLYYEISENFGGGTEGDMAASDFLYSGGITGIRYFDDMEAKRVIDPDEVWVGDPGWEDKMREINAYNYTVFNPGKIRESRAEFDPSKIDSDGLLD